MGGHPLANVRFGDPSATEHGSERGTQTFLAETQT